MIPFFALPVPAGDLEGRARQRRDYNPRPTRFAIAWKPGKAATLRENLRSVFDVSPATVPDYVLDDVRSPSGFRVLSERHKPGEIIVVSYSAPDGVRHLERFVLVDDARDTLRLEPAGPIPELTRRVLVGTGDGTPIGIRSIEITDADAAFLEACRPADVQPIPAEILKGHGSTLAQEWPDAPPEAAPFAKPSKKLPKACRFGSCRCRKGAR